jgi:general stress protein YciG
MPGCHCYGDGVVVNINGNITMAQENKGGLGQGGQGGQSERGFASMDEKKQRDIASKGGQSQGQENNPGNFANDREKVSEAGKKGGQS